MFEFNETRASIEIKSCILTCWIFCQSSYRGDQDWDFFYRFCNLPTLEMHSSGIFLQIDWTSINVASLSHSLPRMKYIWTGHMCAVAAYGVCGTELWTPLLTTVRCNSKVLVRISISEHVLCVFIPVWYEKCDTWLWERIPKYPLLRS